MEMLNNIIQNIGLGVAILTLIVTFLGILIAIKSLKFQTTATIKSSIMEAHKLVIEFNSKICTGDDKDNIHTDIRIKAIYSHYLNAFENICNWFLEHYISKKEFEKEYKSLLSNAVADHIARDILNKSNEYSGIKKAANYYKISLAV